MTVIHQAFEGTVVRRGDAIAVRSGTRALSYRELNGTANRLARYLVGQGVGRETPVAVVNTGGVDVVVALLAILKAGGSYLGVDLHQPADRVQSMLAAAGVSLVFDDVAGRPGLEGLAKVVSLASIGDELDLFAEMNLDGPTDEAAIAYLAYTSGSTGVPKAAMIPHQAVVRLVQDANFLTVVDDDVFLQLAPLAFDASTLELWAPLLNGATLVVPEAPVTGAGEIAELVTGTGVSVLWLTAGLFQQFVRSNAEDLAGLRCLIAGGDVLPVPTVNDALERLPGVRLVNGYGPTENTTFTCCYLITEPQDERVPIGSAITGTSVYLLDDELRPVPDGTAGELCAAGLGLARGYLDRPALTAERFVPDPIADQPGGRMYRTGDLARRRPDGVIEFLGRIDNQVKIRGFRVETGEVEAALAALPEVRDAAVVAQQSRAGKRLIGFVVPSTPGGAAPLSLRRTLATVVPDYAVPSMIVLLDELPLNSNGKVDRAALERHQGRARPADLSTDFREPATETEQLVADVWELMMDRSSIGIDDDFFELGGHSLIAVGITGELSTACGVTLGPRHFYENPTIGELAALVDELQSDQTADAAGAAAR